MSAYRSYPLLGKIHGRIRTSGFVMQRMSQFVGTIDELQNDRILITANKHVEILADPGQLRRFDLKVGDRVAVLLGDDDEIFLWRFPLIERSRIFTRAITT